MRKFAELSSKESYMSKARPTEMTFVLLGRDAAAPVAIMRWVEERIRLGKNTVTDPQIVEAIDCAAHMETERAEVVARQTFQHVEAP